MPLKLRRAADQFPKAGWPPSDSELVVMHDEHVIGSLRRIDGGPRQDNWSWSITACYAPPGVMTLHGTADSKDACAKTLRKWLDYIGAAELTEEILTARYRRPLTVMRVNGFVSRCAGGPFEEPVASPLCRFQKANPAEAGFRHTRLFIC